jgi:hypothetical protein
MTSTQIVLAARRLPNEPPPTPAGAYWYALDTSSAAPTASRERTPPVATRSALRSARWADCSAVLAAGMIVQS